MKKSPRDNVKWKNQSVESNVEYKPMGGGRENIPMYVPTGTGMTDEKLFVVVALGNGTKAGEERLLILCLSAKIEILNTSM